MFLGSATRYQGYQSALIGVACSGIATIQPCAFALSEAGAVRGLGRKAVSNTQAPLVFGFSNFMWDDKFRKMFNAR